MDSSLAESMNAHVFTTNTSASSALAVISMPLRTTLPSMISASTRFLAQPRLIMPTFGGAAISTFIDGLTIFYRGRTVADGLGRGVPLILGRGLGAGLVRRGE